MQSNHYIQQSKKDPNKFDVLYGPNRVFNELESADFAQDIADKLNDTYRAGYQGAEDALRIKVMSMLFGK